MSILLKCSVKYRGYFLKHSFDELANNPHLAQRNYLLQILGENKNTEYGLKHGFQSIKNEIEFRNNVPINSYNDLHPYIDKIVHGHKNVLTREMPLMFNMTSGTIDKPKLIPVTNNTRKRTISLNHQWLYRTLSDHPSCLDKFNLTITSPAVEGYTSSGIPFGSASGLIYMNLSKLVRRSFVLPFVVSNIKDYDLKYYLMARLAYEKDVSFIATPNPSTLLKLAEIGIEHQEVIIQSIHDGILFCGNQNTNYDNDLQIINNINSVLKPNRQRSQYLENVLKSDGSLIPYKCWPSLKVLGCWLGGSIGYHADKLSLYYGTIPKRDLGYMASEGCITIPYNDNTPAGILAIQNNYYEFIADDEENELEPEIKLGHELAIGKQYKILLTNDSGLYRYDINDTIRVDSMYNKVPVVSFISKSDNVLNITGEKVHTNQIKITFDKIQDEFNIRIITYRVASNLEKLRYEIYLLLKGDAPNELIRSSIIPAFDLSLSKLNIEYAQKRKSKRLNLPRVHIMDIMWEEYVRKRLVETGKRDIQYKWRYISQEVLAVDSEYIKYSISCEE